MAVITLFTITGSSVGPYQNRFNVEIRLGYDGVTSSGYNMYVRYLVNTTANPTGSTFTSNLNCSWTTSTYSLGGGTGYQVDSGWTSLGHKTYGTKVSQYAKCYYNGSSGTYTSDATATYTIPLPKCTIHYNSNGGTGTMDDQSFDYGDTGYLNVNTFTKVGHTFIGWNLYRNADSKWYSSGWYTEDEISTKGQTKTLYPDESICGINSSWLNGCVNARDFTFYAVWTVNTYTNNVKHIAFGFENQDGNNNENYFLLQETSFDSNYNSTYEISSDKAVIIPNGFYLSESFAAKDLNNTWITYEMPTSFIQEAREVEFQYNYYPCNYEIVYNLDGGINSSNNPTTYNVLYGITLYNPTKIGYEFVGWEDQYKNLVTGINEGKKAEFINVDELRSELDSRTTGNIILTAIWKPLNIAYGRPNEVWNLYYVYKKANGSWYPSILYVRPNNEYIR
jgi:uncharacterized repeat protein (TIGR02543 family)